MWFRRAWWFWAALGLALGGYAAMREPVAGVVGALAVGALSVAVAPRPRVRPPSPSEPTAAEPKSLETLGLLAGGIAHDFNNLLTGILGNTNLALRTLPDGEAREAVTEADAAARRAREMVAQVLAFSGRGRLELIPIEPAPVVAETVQLLQRVVNPQTRLVVVNPRALGEPLAVEADPVQLRQVVMNLVTNASEALGGAPGEVRVRIAAEVLDRAALDATALGRALVPGEYVLIEVRDDGCGMDADVSARMFDPYFTTKLTGRGLGLAALESIVRHHRGTIGVQSAPGQGTTMRVWLPRAHRTDDADVTPHLLTPLPPRRLGTVLLAEDEELVRRVTTRMLSKLGYQVIAVHDGPSAVAVLDRDGPELVLAIVDFMMPGLDGGRVVEHLRQHYPALPAIIMTGYAGSEQDRSATQPDAWLRKPFALADLLTALDDAQRAEIRRTTPPPVSRSISP